MKIIDLIKNIFKKASKKSINVKKGPKKQGFKKKKTYGLLKFQYKSYYKISRTTQRMGVSDHNRHVRKFIEKHKRKPNEYELKKKVRGASHDTISRKGKRGHNSRQWLRQYIYGLQGISYNKRFI